MKNERDIDVYHAARSEENISRMSAYCESTGLKINEKKTQIIAISANKNRTKVWVQAGKESIDSSDTMKLLGFVFNERPYI